MNPDTLLPLARDRVTTRVQLDRVLRPDPPRRGAVVAQQTRRCFHRGEPGAAGPLRLTAEADAQGVTLTVTGPPATPSEEVEQALHAAAGWVGLHDDLAAAREAYAAHPVTRHLATIVGDIRLSRLPRLGEAVGRSILEQLVQGAEARRSITQLVSSVGAPVDGQVWHWPTTAALGTVPAWELRRFGVSHRGARALHATVVAAGPLQRAGRDWNALDRRLLSLPGIGAWTSAETRLRLGDPDAVSVGDYHLPAIVGYGLCGPDGDGPDGRWTDQGMLALLAPFAGQRGRVIRLIEQAASRGLVSRRGRRAPRRPLSAHRYW